MSDYTSDDSNSDSCFGYAEGIEYVLTQIAFPPNALRTFNHDAQVIENTIVAAMSQYDPTFGRAFKGLSLGGSCLDGIKIKLPDEFDLHVKIDLGFIPCPVLVPQRPGFIFLRAPRSDHPCVQHFGGAGYFISRTAIQRWFRHNITAIMPQLQRIRCMEGRVYSVAYVAQGYGVAHKLLATDRYEPWRQISFDFVPAFEFAANEWPAGLRQPVNDGRSWLAVPRKYFDRSENQQDVRSFMLCAPHWERLVLHKKQNLKDSLRLMKALRTANDMPALRSYFLKSIYLGAVQQKCVNWDQAPGRILIRMLVILLHCLLKNHLPFFLVPAHNNLDQLNPGQRRKYARIVSRVLHTLIRRRNADYLSDYDLTNIFGIEME